MLGMGYSLAKSRLLKKNIPLNVMLSLTNRCQSRCGYCRIPFRGQDELSTSQIESLISQIAVMGCRRLGLWGGEPLLRSDIGRIIDHARAKKLWVTLDSNGYLVPEKMNEIKNLNHLLLSYDGPEQAHDLNREPGSHGKVMAAMDACEGRIAFWTLTVLTKHNIDHIDAVLENARERGALACFQLLHHNDIFAGKCDEFLPEESKCRAAIKRIIARKKAGAPVASSFKYLEHILNWRDYRETVSERPLKRTGLSLRRAGGCYAGELYCNVDTDGSVYPCSILAGKVPAVNFLSGGFAKAFESLSGPECSSCLGACFTEYNYLYSLDLDVVAGWWRSLRGKRICCHG